MMFGTTCDVVGVMVDTLVDVVPGALAKAHELQPIRRMPFWGLSKTKVPHLNSGAVY